MMFLAKNLKSTAKCEHHICPDKYKWIKLKRYYKKKEITNRLVIEMLSLFC